MAITNGGQSAQSTPDNCSYERRFKLLSVVGSLVSFEDDYADDCRGAHPSADFRYTTIDLSKPGQLRYARQDDTPMTDVDVEKPGPIASLSDYFNEQLILQALLSDPLIQSALSTENVQKAPETLAQLPSVFAGNDYELGNSDVELRPDFLTRFAFHHLEGDKVAVRISLPPHSGSKQFRHKMLGILLPIPASLKEHFSLAASRHQGFLMSDAEQIAGTRRTTFRRNTDGTGTLNN